jgi:cytochrome c-type biogenesis protein CcmE
VNQSTAAKIILTVAIVVGGAGFFFYSSRSHTSYYKMVDEVTAAPDTWEGKVLKVHGWVEAGSIKEEVVDQEMHRTFILEHKGRRIVVRNTGPKPDTFKDKAEVVAEGRIVLENGEPVLVATNLMAKCPSKYEGANREKLFK